MEIQKVFIRPDKTALVKCPFCSFEQTATVDRVVIKKHLITVRCKCGQVFKAQLESRKHFRKATAISAHYRNLSKEKVPGQAQGAATIARPGNSGRKPWPNCTIINISERGIGIEVRGQHNIAKGDILQIEFTLENFADTEIVQQVVVRGVFERSIGTEFVGDSKYQATLSFFVNC